VATRFYFQANNAPTVSPPIDAGWGNTATFVRRLMGTGKDASTETISGTVAEESSALAFQVVSPPLAAQTFTGTITMVSRVRELDAADNINKRVRAVRVYASDASTLRGTLSAYNQTSSPSEFGTTLQGQVHAQNNGIGTISVEAGDIIVVEFGFGMSGVTGDGNNQWETQIGGDGTDHAVSNGDTTGTVAWVEFSANLTFAAATVSLTPATATLAAKSNTATPGPVTRSLTAAVSSVAGRALTPVPGSVTVNLTPATGASAAVTVSPTPNAVVLALTPAAASSSARAVTPSPGLVVTSILPGLLDFTPLTVQPQPLAPNVNLTAATATLTGRTVTPVPGMVTQPLTAAAATLAGVAATDVEPGEVIMTLAPAVVPVEAMDFGLTPGLVNVNLTAAPVAASARQLTPAGVGPSGITLTPAVVTASGVFIDANPGLVLTPLTRAAGTWEGVPVTATPGPITRPLTAATATLAGATVSAAPGAVSLSLTAAAATVSGASLGLTPGALTTATGFGTGAWSAVAVVPAPVQGVLLRPALTTITARKLKPVGSVLPLNTYELPLAQVLLDSLRDVLVNRTDNPPMHFSLRTGEQVAHDMSQTEDLCCEGLAYVKVNRVYPSADFPNEDEEWMPCAPLAWAADLEIGILRCAPTGDVNAMPTDAEWVATTDIVANDSAAIRLAVQDFAARVDPLTDYMVRPWLPFGPQGACTGGTQIVTVGWIPC
jgi:uncharacterized cupin superfamily protein